MSISKGAPLKAFSTVTAFWILARFVWESINPAAELQPMQVAEANQRSLQQAKAKLSLDQESLFTDHLKRVTASFRPEDHQAQRAAFDLRPKFSAVRPLNLLVERSPVPPKRYEQPEPMALIKELSSTPPGRISESKRVASLSSSSKPLSGYFWTFLRQGSGSLGFGQTVPTLQSPAGQYGGSQAGAILTYRLAGNHRRNLSAFVRAATALSNADDEELAIGMKVKPLASVPMSLFAEQRIGPEGLQNRGTAFYVAGGTGPNRLLFDADLETYGQAGYILSNDSSYFFDASATLQRKILERDNYKVTAGGGIWAGGQEGLTRLDIGPRANIYVPVGKMDMRFSLDWRQRVGGNAIPDSGVALTVTTGF